MAVNLSERFISTYSDALVRQMSSTLGESAESVASAVAIGSHITLAGIVAKDKMPNGLDELISNLAGNPAATLDQEQIDQLSSTGAEALRQLFGDKQHIVIDHVSSHARLKTSSSSTLLKVIASLMLGMISEYKRELTLGRFDSRKVLEEQIDYLKSALPLSLQSEIGLTSDFVMASTTNTASQQTVSTEDGTTLSKLLPWIVLLLTALGLFYFVEKGCGGNMPAENQHQEMQIDSTDLDSI